MKKSTRVLVGLGLVSAASASMAAVDAGVTSALTTAGTDGATVGAAVLVVIVGIAAFKYIRRAL